MVKRVQLCRGFGVMRMTFCTCLVNLSSTQNRKFSVFCPAASGSDRLHWLCSARLGSGQEYGWPCLRRRKLLRRARSVLKTGNLPERGPRPPQPRSALRLRTISPRSSATGAPSSRSPTAPCSRVSTAVSLWQQHIGQRQGIRPIVRHRPRQPRATVVFSCRSPSNAAALRRRLTFLGTTLCDYNGPACAGVRRAGRRRALSRPAGARSSGRLQSHPDYGFDVVHFDKMQRTVGAQPNPFIDWRYPARQRRSSHEARHRLGRLLRGQAFLGDARA